MKINVSLNTFKCFIFDYPVLKYVNYRCMDVGHTAQNKILIKFC